MKILHALILLVVCQTSDACEILEKIINNDKSKTISITRYINIYDIDLTPESALNKLKEKFPESSNENGLVLNQGQCEGVHWESRIHLNPVVLGDDLNGLVITVRTFHDNGDFIDEFAIANFLSYEDYATEKSSEQFSGDTFRVCERAVKLYQYIDTEERVEYFNPPIKSACKTETYSLINGYFKKH